MLPKAIKGSSRMRGMGVAVLGRRVFALSVALGIFSAFPATAAVPAYIKAVYSLPLTFDPIKMNDTASLVAGNLLYDGLLRFSPSLKLEGALADSWATSADGKVLTFMLRPDARFHDGSIVEAEDVVFSLRRALSPESEVRKYYDCIQEIRAKDARTVVIRLKQSFPPFLSVLAGATAKVLPRRLAAKPGFFDHPVGSGGFRFVKRLTAPYKDLRLSAFVGYYRGAPQLGELILRELDEQAAKKGAATGDVHDLANWPLAADDEVFRHGSNSSSPVAATWIIGLNARKAPFSDVKVRRLFRHDLDAEAFRARFYSDAAPAKGYIPPGLPGSGVVPAAGEIAKHPPKERIMLVIPQELARAEEMRKFLESGLRAKGWNATVRVMAWADLMAGYDRKEHQAFLVSMNMDYPDSEFLLRNFESTNPDNFSGLKNARLDRILRDARSTQDRRKRESLYRSAVEIVESQAVTVNLFYPRANYWTSTCVEGFQPNILSDVYIDYAKVSLRDECAGMVVQR